MQAFRSRYTPFIRSQDRSYLRSRGTSLPREPSRHLVTSVRGWQPVNYERNVYSDVVRRLPR